MATMNDFSGKLTNIAIFCFEKEKGKLRFQWFTGAIFQFIGQMILIIFYAEQFKKRRQ